MTETDGEPDKTETGATGLPASNADAPSPDPVTPGNEPSQAVEPESGAAEIAAFRAAATMEIDVTEVKRLEPPNQPVESQTAESEAAESEAAASEAAASEAAESEAAESEAAEIAAFRAAETMEIDSPSIEPAGVAAPPSDPEPAPAEAVIEPVTDQPASEAPRPESSATTPAPRATKIEMAETVNLEGHQRESEDRSSFGLIDRLLLVVSSPSKLFSRLTPGTGWAIPMVFVMAASLGQATVSMNLTDVDRWFEVQQEKQKAAMPDWQKRALARMDEKARRTQKRMQLFALKMALFVLPLITTLAGLVIWSTLVFVASAAGEGRRNFALALSVVAHAQLLYVYQSLALAVTAAGTGLPMPQSSLVALTPMAGDVGSALLAWTDPFFFVFVLLLVFGLIHGMKVRSKGKALSVLLVTLLLVFGGSVGVRIAAAKYMPGAQGAAGGDNSSGMGGGRRRGRRRGRGPF